MEQTRTGGAGEQPRGAPGEEPAKRIIGADAPAAAAAAESGFGCFDCNICLECATEPVVTLCGHLYCWPCIYEWLRPDAEAGAMSSARRQCPVCKAAVSPDALVPRRELQRQEAAGQHPAPAGPATERARQRRRRPPPSSRRDRRASPDAAAPRRHPRRAVRRPPPHAVRGPRHDALDGRRDGGGRPPAGAPWAGAAAGHVLLGHLPSDEPQAETVAYGGREVPASDMVLPLRVRGAVLALVLISEAGHECAPCDVLRT